MGEPRVVVITGASRGIGAHLAAAFTAAGDVVEASSLGGGDGVAALDVTDGDAVRSHVGGVLARHGRIDVLINNAGVVDAEVPFSASDPQQWWRTVEVDVRGPYLMARAVVPAMLARGEGRVIAINSGAGTRASARTSAYYVAKSALGRITGAVHEEGGGLVHAFDLMPGVVRTDMTSSMPAHRERDEWTSPAAVTELALALASGALDAWSGRMVRAGVDTPASLERAARTGLDARARTVSLIGYGDGDPLG